MPSAGQLPVVNVCEVYRVAKKNAFWWKWRYTDPDGCTNVCAEEYAVVFECVEAARASGYEARSDWTRPCLEYKRK